MISTIEKINKKLQTLLLSKKILQEKCSHTKARPIHAFANSEFETLHCRECDKTFVSKRKK